MSVDSSGGAAVARSVEIPPSNARTPVTGQGRATFHAAQVADVLRSNEKNVFFMDQIKQRLNELVVELDSQRAYQLEWSVDLASKVMYLVITLMAAGKTLGEEYVSIEPSTLINSEVLHKPSKWRMALFVILSTSPLWIRKLILRLFKLTDLQKRLLNDWCSIVLPIISSLQLYYLYRSKNTRYYSVSHWISGITWFYNGFDLHPKSARFTDYRSLCFIHLVIVLTLLIYKIYQYWIKYRHLWINNDKDNDNGEGMNGEYGESHSASQLSTNGKIIASKKDCFVCLNRCENPTVTECGHIYCWDCIADWCSSNNECPLCRNYILPQKLICLLNI